MRNIFSTSGSRARQNHVSQDRWAIQRHLLRHHAVEQKPRKSQLFIWGVS
jgi:hypothetical protein